MVCEHSLVFLSTNSITWSTNKALANFIKCTRSDVKICIGGPHSTLYKQSLDELELFNCVVSGYADNKIASIYNKMLSIKTHDSQLSINDLATNGLELTYAILAETSYKSVPVETSRGCKLNCSFCSIYGKRNWQGNSVEQTFDKIKLAYDVYIKYNKERVQVIDNCFTADATRILTLAQQLEAHNMREFLSYDATVSDMQSEELAIALAPLTNHIFIGAEVATKQDARRIKKPVTPVMIEKAAYNLYKASLSHKAIFSFIIGFPWQTADDCEKTIRFIINLENKYRIRALVQWYWPIPGSLIWQEMEIANTVSLSWLDDMTIGNYINIFMAARSFGLAEVQAIENKIRLLDSILRLREKNINIPKLLLTNSPFPVISMNNKHNYRINSEVGI